MATIEDRPDHRLAPWLLAALLAGMALLVSISPRHPIYDEGPYLSNTERVAHYGPGREFLLEMKYPAGPLFPVVQHLFAPLTGGSAPGVRFVSFFFLLLMLGGVWLCAGDRERQAPLWVLAAPMVWVVSCLALTEMPALGCLLLGLAAYLPVRVKATCGAGPGLLRAATGGLLLSLAIVGRQPLLVVVPASAALLLCPGTDRLRWSTFVLFAVPLPLLVFSVWGGLMPPKGTGFVTESGLRLVNPVLTLAYIGIVALAFVPGWFRLRLRSSLLVLLLAVGFNLVFGFVARVPLQARMEALLPEPLFRASQGVFGGLLLGVGVLFGLASLVQLRERRRDAEFVFLTLIVLLTAAASARVTHQFSSRYAAPAIPLLAVLSARFVPRNPWWRLVGTTLGGLAGAAAVAGYYLAHSP